MVKMFILDFLSYHLKGVSVAPCGQKKYCNMSQAHTPGGGEGVGWLGTQEGIQVCTGTYRRSLNNYLFVQQMCVYSFCEFTSEPFPFLRRKKIFDVCCIYCSAWCALTNTPHWIIYLYFFGFMTVVNLDVDNCSVLCWCESNKTPVKI